MPVHQRLRHSPYRPRGFPWIHALGSIVLMASSPEPIPAINFWSDVRADQERSLSRQPLSTRAHFGNKVEFELRAAIRATRSVPLTAAEASSAFGISPMTSAIAPVFHLVTDIWLYRMSDGP